jgi:hypothetical protein
MQNAEVNSTPHSAFRTPHSSESPTSVPENRVKDPGQEHLARVAEQILLELRKRNDQSHTEFSVSKLLAGIVQVLVLAALFFAYVNRNDGSQIASLLVAMTLQATTISLLIMGRQR